MARPRKNGLDYFPLMTSYYENEKLLDLNLEYGYLSEIVYIRILANVYQHGYYMEMSEQTLVKLIRRQLGGIKTPSSELLTRIIRNIGELGLLDNNLKNQGVITSFGIQRQFILSTKRRKNVDIRKYWLLDDTEMLRLKAFLETPSNEISVDNNLVNVDNNSINVYRSTQSKSKKKRESLKDKEDIFDKEKSSIDTYQSQISFYPKRLSFLTTVLIKNKVIDIYDENLEYFDSIWKEAEEEYEFEEIKKVVFYVCKRINDSDEVILDKYGYIKKAVIENLESLKNREEFDERMVKEYAEYQKQ